MIFVGQYNLTIQLDCHTDVSSGTTPRVLYRKPSGTTGYWSGSVSGNYVQYNLASNDLNEAGVWTFQAYVVLGGKVAYGDKVTQKVESPVA